MPRQAEPAETTATVGKMSAANPATTTPKTTSILKADDEEPDAWDQAAWKLKHDAMHAMMDTIKAAHEELRKR